MQLLVLLQLCSAGQAPGELRRTRAIGHSLEPEARTQSMYFDFIITRRSSVDLEADAMVAWEGAGCCFTTADSAAVKSRSNTGLVRAWYRGVNAP